MVAGGCMSAAATENCTWISGDGIFIARARGFDAARPNTLNDARTWDFYAGGQRWSPQVRAARPAFAWPVLRLFPPCALISHAQGSSGVVD